MICKKMNGHENFPLVSPVCQLGMDGLAGYSGPIPQRGLSAFVQILNIKFIGRKSFTSPITATEEWLYRPIWRSDWTLEGVG